MEESSDRGGEELATEDDTVALERRTKARHDPRYVARTAKEKSSARTPPSRKRRVVAMSSAEESEKDRSSRGGDDDLHQDFRYVSSPVNVHTR